MLKAAGKYCGVWFILLLHVVFSGATTLSLAEDLLPLRLIALLDRDDQGERIGFPISLYYDHWASETYLISSTGRITIFDQKYFPVASFGKGRGVTAPSGITVDRRGSIYVCQDVDGKAGKSRLTVFNQAFFPIKEIVFADMPELADFTASKVAVAESGEIYLSGQRGSGQLAGVVVLTPDGKFSRYLLTPEKNAWRQFAKVETTADKGVQGNLTTPVAGDTSEPAAIPAGLKPKSSAGKRDDDEDRGRMEPAGIDDVKIDRQGRIYLLSREVSYIYVLNAKGEYLFKFGEKGGVYGKLSNPVSLGVDLERRVIYVCDYMRHTILCYDYDSGHFLYEFGGRGTGPLWFNYPNNVEVDQRGQVVISDLFNRRIQVIDSNMNERRPMAGLLPPPSTTGNKPLSEELPPPPPGPAAPSLQGAVLAPAAVMPFLLPDGIVGLRGSEPLLVQSAALRLPPARGRHDTPRELHPRQLKRIPVPGPQLILAEFSPVRSPERFARPAPVRFSKGKVAPVKIRRPGDVAALGMEGFQSMPAAVGVYGPVVSLVGVGSRMLSTKR